MAHFRIQNIKSRVAVILAAVIAVILATGAVVGVLAAKAAKETSVPLREVLYYGEIRLGVYDATFTTDALVEEAGGALGADYEIEDLLSLRTEMTEDEALTYDECLTALSAAVRDGYTTALEIKIDGKFIAYAENEETAGAAFDAFLAAYKNGSGYEGSACFKDVETAYRTVDKDDVLTSEELRSLLALCADRDDLLLEVDHEKLHDYMSENDTPPVVPVIVQEFCVTSFADVPYETVILPDNTLYAGQTVLKTKGVSGVKEIHILKTYENGELVSEEILHETIKVLPVDEVILQGILPDGSATGSFIWTTNEGRVTSLFGYRRIFGSLDFHSGIDVAIPTGTPLYAGDGGKVVFAGRNGSSYGVFVRIDHGNGFETIYAHMSRVSVEVGDLVNKGDLIGYSGATGRVTGPHVHYEFHLNGEAVNPKNYLPAR